MSFESVNPATGESFARYETWDEPRIEAALTRAAAATSEWAARPIAERAAHMRRAAGVLRERQEEFARTMSLEMGKLLGEARAEVEKCAWCCEFYAEHGPVYLADEAIATDAQRSLVVYQPLGAVLAIMPWNFPFWQVIRFAAPALVAGNVGLLKHASNVPRCALQLEEIFTQSGFPPGVFTTLMIAGSQADRVIADARVHAVTLTGSS
ncbi:MAG TPA: aldehyde dehydrogenase family protein, partial [Oscillatoriaceae cyanobacterium]